MINIDIHLPRKNFNVVVQEKFSEGITGIFGPSGSGKTSLLQCISGLARPKEGYISVGGRILFDSVKNINIPVSERNVGYVFQEGRLFPHMSVEKNLRYGIKKQAIGKISYEEVIDLLGLRHILKSKPHQISGGERQRTALGRTLLSSPDILLLDEPFSAVDMSLRSQILPFIIRIQKLIQIPMLVVSHDIPDLLKLTNRLCIIKNGSCIGHGEYYDLLKDPSVSNIFGSGSIVNSIDMRVLHTNPQSRLTIVGWKQDGQEILITCDKSKGDYKEGQKLKIFIDADDIALSTEKTNNISIQNQVYGTVTDIIPKGATLLVVIDAGFKLVVEITLDSLSRMGIGTGSKIWCLFKSVAIDVAG
ncbi:molybdenum ABC transporter ATP-binding protein [Plebeiibacterium marinum]|uniref:Molybdenum ABC transporter ATP-binding protein n=1 Tax=Plebeiibacterium marinum TaxID=2992111 RepID=A0AAE3SLS0_9BACT|nr:molybdenum ABC transporter ATP-binding protein [Plebeiobacterium marinum]MCW3807982.1 molybdenum ABC transporter ATP-binding protein [Plebeiobacterium marinum]